MRFGSLASADGTAMRALADGFEEAGITLTLTQAELAAVCGISPYRVGRRVRAARDLDAWTDDLPEPTNRWRDDRPEWAFCDVLRWLASRPMTRDI